MFSIWNETADIQVLIACALSRSLALQKENGDSGAESVLGAADFEA
jgi:hypothetical protein